MRRTKQAEHTPHSKCWVCGKVGHTEDMVEVPIAGLQIHRELSSSDAACSFCISAPPRDRGNTFVHKECCPIERGPVWVANVLGERQIAKAADKRQKLAEDYKARGKKSNKGANK